MEGSPANFNKGDDQQTQHLIHTFYIPFFHSLDLDMIQCLFVDCFILSVLFSLSVDNLVCDVTSVKDIKSLRKNPISVDSRSHSISAVTYSRHLTRIIDVTKDCINQNTAVCNIKV